MTEMINSFFGRYRFLSNFYPSPIVIGGVEYATVEHAFQAAKTTDPEVRGYIASCASPGDAKRAGRRARLREDWEAVKVPIMTALVSEKFWDHPTLAKALLDTEDAVLIEGNTWGDRIWGVCDGQGQNLLCTILMFVRNQIRGSHLLELMGRQ